MNTINRQNRAALLIRAFTKNITQILTALSFLIALISCSNKAVLSNTTSNPSSENESRLVLVTSEGAIIDVNEDSDLNLRSTELVSTKILRAANLTWDITYRDVTNSSGVGFDDHNWGAMRRKALEDTLLLIDDSLNLRQRVTVQLLVDVSRNVNDSTLASAGTFYNSSTNGFIDGFFARHTQSGIDPDLSAPDMYLQVNFFHPYNLESRWPTSNEYDFTSIIMHEAMHAVGIASFVGPDTNSTLSRSNPGIYTRFDQYIGDASKQPLTGAGGYLYATSDQLTGGNGGLSWLGPLTNTTYGAPTLFTPPTFSEGSSIGHWSDNAAGLMRPAIARGAISRRISDFEVSALRDLGYSDARSPTSTLIAFNEVKTFLQTGYSHSGTALDLFRNGRPVFATLSTESNSSKLHIYPDFDGSSQYTLELGEIYSKMSTQQPIGPNNGHGFVLASASESKILSLSGLKLPNNRRVLYFDDFEHVHSVQKRKKTNFTITSMDDQHLATEDLNNDSLFDVLTYTPKVGFRRFFNDRQGYLDGFKSTKEFKNLNQLSSPVRSMSISTDHNKKTIIDIASGIGIPKVTRVNLTGRNSTLSINGYPRLSLLTHFKSFSSNGIAVFSNVTKNETYLTRVNLVNGVFQVTWTQKIEGNIGALHILDNKSALLTNRSKHAVYIMDIFGTSQPQLLTGGKQGFSDGSFENAKFNDPISVCGNGTTGYIVERGNKLIRKLDLSTKTVTSLSGVLGKSGMNSGPRGQGTYSFESHSAYAHHCAINGDSLYIYDDKQNHRADAMRKVNLKTGYVSFDWSWKANDSTRVTSSNNGKRQSNDTLDDFYIPG